MQKLVIKKTEDTPAVIFIPENNIFQIVATSWPENASEFYKPVLQWIQNYFNNSPLKETIFQFRLEYINSASSKQVAKILKLLKDFSSDNNKIKIKWYYEKGDFDMRKEGKRFAMILNLDIELIEK